MTITPKKTAAIFYAIRADKIGRYRDRWQLFLKPKRQAG
jgi:hypothetical protein